MTDTAETMTLEARVAALEARLVQPLATVPPITVGALTNVPVPGSQIAAQWAQDASGMVVHRFANKAALTAWAAPNGAVAVAADTGVMWRRIGGAWSQVTPWAGSAVGLAFGVPGAFAPAATTQISIVTVPADPGPRVLLATCDLRIRVVKSAFCTVQLYAVGVNVATWEIQPTADTIVDSDNARTYNVHMAVPNIALPANTAVNVQVYTTADATKMFWTVADITLNRVGAIAAPRGF
jgi:hypothetical protein